MTKLLRATLFGNPVLREPARKLSKPEILSPGIQALIADMRYTIANRKYGVGLAAPQVGHGVAISIIAIKPRPNRPGLEPFESVIINPEISETFGYRKPMWEGCVSAGTASNTLFAQVPRYKKVRLTWYDQQARRHSKILEGLPAHVAQHEVDHLNGILFVDKVKDPRTFMMTSEYRKRVVRADRPGARRVRRPGLSLRG